MTKFLVFQHTHSGIGAALFQGRELLEKIFEDKKRSSKYLVVMIDSLLKKSKLGLGDLSFIAANQGPGPFTTLRVVIASVNGLSFSCNKPLIGIDGLDAILQEFRNETYPITVALLDAYSKDVYFGIDYVQGPERKKGYKNIDVFLSDLKDSSENNKIQFIGDGVLKYRDEISDAFGEKAFFPDPLPLNCSIEQVGIIAYEKWKKQVGLSDQLFPLYLKSMEIKKVMPSSF